MNIYHIFFSKKLVYKIQFTLAVTKISLNVFVYNARAHSREMFSAIFNLEIDW